MHHGLSGTLFAIVCLPCVPTSLPCRAEDCMALPVLYLYSHGHLDSVTTHCVGCGHCMIKAQVSHVGWLVIWCGLVGHAVQQQDSGLICKLSLWWKLSVPAYGSCEAGSDWQLPSGLSLG